MREGVFVLNGRSFGDAATNGLKSDACKELDMRSENPIVRRCQRLLLMVHELHKRGYQRLRIAPSMAPSGLYWRCHIVASRDTTSIHGALIDQYGHSLEAVYSSGQDNEYFGWKDAKTDTARQLADKFIERFPELAQAARGKDYEYAGWFVEMLGIIESDGLPFAYAEYCPPWHTGRLYVTDSDTTTAPAPIAPEHKRKSPAALHRTGSGVVRVIARNLNHRTFKKVIDPAMVQVVGRLDPDLIIFTEYVPGPSNDEFLNGLAECGLSHVRQSDYVPRENAVLIASRMPLKKGTLSGPPIHKSIPSNVLHVVVDELDLDLVGIRIPDYSRDPETRRACWDWVLSIREQLNARNSMMIGDFNTDPKYPPSRCGDRIEMLSHKGWECASPEEGVSYWSLKGSPCRIDHAFVSGNAIIRRSAYIAACGEYVLASVNHDGLSDHAAICVALDL